MAEVHLAARAGAVRAGAMPASIHADHEARPWLAGRFETDEIWVAEVAQEVVGYLRMTTEWLDDLYVVPDHAGQGIGAALLEVAKVRRPGGFGLWVFATNGAARAFYARYGLTAVEWTDGQENEERAPDIKMTWRP